VKIAVYILKIGSNANLFEGKRKAVPSHFIKECGGFGRYLQLFLTSSLDISN